MPGGSSCPSFVPADLVRGLQQNHVATDILVAFMEGIGSVMSAVIPFSGSPFQAFGLVISGLENNCDVEGTLKAQAKLAATACTISAISCGIGAALAALSVVGIPTTVPFAALGATFGTLAPILGALGEGRTPKISDVGSFFGAAASLSGVVDADTAGKLASSVPVDKLLKDKNLKGALQSANAAGKSVSRSAAVAAAKDKSRNALDACEQSGGKYDPAYGKCMTPRDYAVEQAKAKSAAELAALEAAGGHYGPAPTIGRASPVLATPTNPFAGVVDVPQPHLTLITNPPPSTTTDTPPSLTKVHGSHRNRNRAAFAGVGAVGGFVVGGPIGAAIGAGLGLLAEHAGEKA